VFRGPRDVWEQFHEEHTRSVYRRVLDSGLVTFLGQHNSTLLLPSARGHAILVGTFIDVIDLATCPDRIHAQRASQQKKGLVTLFEKHTHEDLGFAARSVVFFARQRTRFPLPLLVSRNSNTISKISPWGRPSGAGSEFRVAFFTVILTRSPLFFSKFYARNSKQVALKFAKNSSETHRWLLLPFRCFYCFMLFLLSLQVEPRSTDVHMGQQGQDDLA
jgi:hypothetical protein